MSKRSATDSAGDDSDYEPHNQENSKRTRRAPNPSMKNGEPLFSASLGANVMVQPNLPTTIPANLSNPSISNLPPNIGNTLANPGSLSGATIPTSSLPTPSSLAGHSMMPTLPSAANFVSNMNLDHLTGHQSLLPNMAQLAGVTGVSSVSSLSVAQSHSASIKTEDDDGKVGDEISPQDLQILNDPELCSRLRSIPYDENDSKSSEYSKVDMRNSYFFAVMNTVIDFMVEKKYPCKQITRLYGICGQYIQSTSKFPEIKAKTISNEYSCANSWTSKVQAIQRESQPNVSDPSQLLIPRETVENFPKPFEKYFEPVEGSASMRVKPMYVDVYNAFVVIRDKMRQLKENAGCNVQPKSDTPGKGLRGRKARKALGVGKLSSMLTADGTPLLLGPYDSISSKLQEALEHAELEGKHGALQEQLNNMVVPAGINTATLSSLMALNPAASSGLSPLSQLVLNSLPTTFGKLPPLAYPLPYPVVPGHNIDTQGGELKPFLSYIPCVLVPVCVTSQQMDEIQQHLSHAQAGDKQEEERMGGGMLPTNAMANTPMSAPGLSSALPASMPTMPTGLGQQSLPSSISSMATSIMPNTLANSIPAVSVLSAGGNNNQAVLGGSGMSQLNQPSVVVPVNPGNPGANANVNVSAVSPNAQTAHIAPLQQGMGTGQLPGNLNAAHIIPPMMAPSMNMNFAQNSMPMHLLSMPTMPILNVTNVGQGGQGGQAPMSTLRMVGSNIPAMNNGMIPHMSAHMHNTIMLSGAGMNQQGNQDTQDIPNIQGD